MTCHALPDAWMDRLFARLAVRYGAAWARMWEGVPMDAVRADWAQKLAGFEAHPDAIAYGLDNLPPDRPPTVGQFAGLCNRSPEKAPPQLEAPKAEPERVRAALAAMRQPVQAREWTQRLQARIDAGYRPTFAQRAMLQGTMACGPARGDEGWQ
jgi:hypothetical protein